MSNIPLIFKYVLLFVFVFGLTTTTMAQQENPNRPIFSIQGGLNFGGQVSSNNFTYKSGNNLQLGVMKSISEKTKLGVGIGQVQMKSDYFYPVHFRLESSIFKNPYHALLVQTGYSFAQTRAEETLLNLELDGGFFIEVGRIWTIPLNDKISLQSAVSFTYQLAEMKYESPGNSYEENVDYIWAQLKVGLAFQ